MYSRTLSSAQLIEMIGIDPEERWDRGERPGRVGERACVRYVSAPPRRANVRDHVSALLDRLAPAAPGLRAVGGAPGVEVTLSIGLFINEPQWQVEGDSVRVRGLGVSLKPDEIAAISAMGAAFDVDIYVNYGEHEGDLGP